jgi:hypothetical protein
MRSNPFWFLSFLFARAGLALSFTAQAAVPDPSATIEKDRRVYLININGTWAMKRDLSIRINNARAVATFANQAFDSNAALETPGMRAGRDLRPDDARGTDGNLSDEPAAPNP